MRINKYLADKQYASRRQADKLIEEGLVFINGTKARLGDQVSESDTIEVKKSKNHKEPAYFAYNKPVGIVTHSPQGDDIDIKTAIEHQTKMRDLFPIGRLDKDSHGLIILTNDGRITGKLLDPEESHEKEYIVETKEKLIFNFDQLMERGVMIEDGNGKKFKTKPCIVRIMNDKKFSIILTEGKKRQIRRMCESLRINVTDLKRIRVMNIHLGHLEDGGLRKIKGKELVEFLEGLGIKNPGTISNC
jgi:23S rRNA pseudouridine2604 synthase